MLLCVLLQVLLESVAPSDAGDIPAARHPASAEFCEAETFQARCPDDHVISMTSALYGRMRNGRCVTRDYGYVGCSADVIKHMDDLCSGFQSCEMRIPDTTLDTVNKCPDDFKTYLEATYECIPVSRIDCSQCRHGNHTLVTSSSGFLAPFSGSSAEPGVTGREPDCGSHRCSWRISVPPGMMINMTLVDFSLEAYNRNQDANRNQNPNFNADACFRYATVSEEAKFEETPVCGGQNRQTHVYTSVSNQVDVELARGRFRDGAAPKFLIHYSTFGCEDFKAPPNAYLKREGDVVLINCLTSGKSYQLVCEENEWTGSVGDCPKGLTSASTVAPEDKETHSTGLMVSIVIGIALVIGSLILTLGLILIKRRRNRRRQDSSDAAYHSTLQSSKIYDQHYGVTAGSEVVGRPCYQTVVHGKGNDYDYTMELRPLPTVPAYSADKAVCSQCFSTYDSFQYGTDSPRVVHVTPPHYFTLETKRHHEPSCLLAQPDVTQTPLISKPAEENSQNSGREEQQCAVHVDQQHNDTGTCSWP